MKDGDMYIRKNSDETFVQQGGMFTHCFLSRQDYDMIDAGMGEYAGEYANAIVLISAKTGMERAVKMSDVYLEFMQINK
jgi:hypothetical protein